MFVLIPYKKWSKNKSNQKIQTFKRRDAEF